MAASTHKINDKRLECILAGGHDPRRTHLQFQTELLDRVYEPVREGLDSVTEKLRRLTRDREPFLAEPLQHALDNMGKRVRPAITLLSSKFHPNDGRNATILAAAIETLHTATLIHDDIVDKSDLRRGKPTVGNLYGVDRAVLLGDYLLATAAGLACDTEDLWVIRRFAQLATELSGGELQEKAEAYSLVQTRPTYLRRIYRKTASLFSVAAEAGATLSGAPEPIIMSLKDYGYNLGMAFQIVDDILDLHETTQELGKPVGNDLAQGVMTLPTIIALERHPGNKAILAVFERPASGTASPWEPCDDILKEALEVVTDPSILEESHLVATEYCDKAVGTLNSLERNAPRESLEGLAECLIRMRT